VRFDPSVPPLLPRNRPFVPQKPCGYIPFLYRKSDPVQREQRECIQDRTEYWQTKSTTGMFYSLKHARQLRTKRHKGNRKPMPA
jgi:hypothetical protein